MPIELTEEDVERSSRRDGINHPVISILEYHEPRIVQLNLEYANISGNSERQGYIARNFGFLADALEGPDEFTVGPLDLVAIWSKATEIWPYSYHLYALAGMLATSYGIHGRPDFRGLSRYYLELGELPAELAADRAGLLHIGNRLTHIDTSLQDLRFYVYGILESPMQLTAELTMKQMAGDQEAARQLEELKQQLDLREGRKTPLLSEIRENFANGMLPFTHDLGKAIKSHDKMKDA